MFDNFIQALPQKVRCSKNLDWGTEYQKKEKALSFPYVELNQFYKKFIALDIDIPGSFELWNDKGLPPPTIIIVNPVTTHTQYFYELKTPVYYTEHARRAPQRFYEDIDLGLTHKLGADLSFASHIVKNPLHKSWRTIVHATTYDLEDFKEYGVECSGHRRQLRKQAETSSVGRNCTLFDTLRFWAYGAVRSYDCHDSFVQAVDKRALEINLTFSTWSSGVLPVKEVLSTAKSVSRYTWSRRFNLGNKKMKRIGILADQITEDMSSTERKRLGADYTNILKRDNLDDKIKHAIYECQQRGLSPTMGNLDKFGVARSTFSKHKDYIKRWVEVMTK